MPRNLRGIQDRRWPEAGRASRLVAAVALVALLGACAGDDGGEGSEPPLGDVLSNPSTAEFQLPLDAYGPSPTERAALDSAEDLLIGRCMAEQGFTFDPPPRSADDGEENRNRYTVIDPEDAAQWGYRPPPDPAADALLQHQQDNPLSDAATVAFFGPQGGGGCLAEAAKALGTDRRQRDGSMLDELGLESYNQSLSDSRVQDAFAEWSECMAEAGYDYDDPLEANDDPLWSAAEGDNDESGDVEDPVQAKEPPSAEVIAAASTDVACKQKANVAGIWLAVESAYQDRHVQENQAELEAIRDRVSAALTAARAELEANPQP